MNHASHKKKFLLIFLTIFLIAAGLSYHSTAFETFGKDPEPEIYR
jgi:hypothetical protein